MIMCYRGVREAQLSFPELPKWVTPVGNTSYYSMDKEASP